MAKLIVGRNYQKRKMCFCDECYNPIYAPSNNVIYKYCYNCGTKFDKEYSAQDMKKLINDGGNKK